MHETFSRSIVAARKRVPRRGQADSPGSLLARAAAQRLDLAAPPLGVEPAGFRGERRSGRAPRLFAVGGALDQCGEPGARVLAVARLAGETLRENDDHAVLRRARPR